MLTSYDEQFAELLRQHRAVKGISISGKHRHVCISEQIRRLFEKIKDPIEVMAFAQRGLGKPPLDGTAEAATYEEIHTIAWAISEKQRQQLRVNTLTRSN